MRKANDQLGVAVKRVLDERGETLRGQRRLTGVSHVTVQAMLQGVVPQMETVAAFARGFGLDVNEWLELAGYDQVEDQAARAALNAVDWFLDRFRELQEAHPDLSIPVPRLQDGLENLTQKVAESVIADLKERIAKGGYRAQSPVVPPE
jgi:hypothetical protein